MFIITFTKRMLQGLGIIIGIMLFGLWQEFVLQTIKIFYGTLNGPKTIFWPASALGLCLAFWAFYQYRLYQKEVQTIKMSAIAKAYPDDPNEILRLSQYSFEEMLLDREKIYRDKEAEIAIVEENYRHKRFLFVINWIFNYPAFTYMGCLLLLR
jgi:hypothetical protein